MSMVLTFPSNGNTVKFRIKDVHIMGDGCALSPTMFIASVQRRKMCIGALEYEVWIYDI